MLKALRLFVCVILMTNYTQRLPFSAVVFLQQVLWQAASACFCLLVYSWSGFISSGRRRHILNTAVSALLLFSPVILSPFHLPHPILTPPPPQHTHSYLLPQSLQITCAHKIWNKSIRRGGGCKTSSQDKHQRLRSWRSRPTSTRFAPRGLFPQGDFHLSVKINFLLLITTQWSQN